MKEKLQGSNPVPYFLISPILNRLIVLHLLKKRKNVGHFESRFINFIFSGNDNLFFFSLTNLPESQNDDLDDSLNSLDDSLDLVQVNVLQSF